MTSNEGIEMNGYETDAARWNELSDWAERGEFDLDEAQVRRGENARADARAILGAAGVLHPTVEAAEVPAIDPETLELTIKYDE